MSETFSSLYEKRRVTLRVRWVGTILVTIALIITRVYVPFDLGRVLFVLGLALTEIAAVTIVLSRLREGVKGIRAVHLYKIVTHLQVAVELTLLTWIVNLTGGVSSPMVGAYLIYLLADGLDSAVVGVLSHSLGAMLLFVGLVLGEFYGYVQHFNVGLFAETEMYRNPQYIDAVLVVIVGLMVLCAFVAIVLNRQIQQRELLLAASAEELARRVQELDMIRSIGQRLVGSLDLDALLDAIAQFGATVCFTAPTSYRAMAPLAEACGPLPTASATPSPPPPALAQWPIQSPPTA